MYCGKNRVQEAGNEASRRRNWELLEVDKKLAYKLTPPLESINRKEKKKEKCEESQTKMSPKRTLKKKSKRKEGQTLRKMRKETGPDRTSTEVSGKTTINFSEHWIRVVIIKLPH
ncbi:unnamed protein product [Lepidochelys kempii]